MLSSKIENSFKVAIITDLHSCRYGKNQNDLIQAINSNQPDLVLFIGDIIDDRMPEDNAYVTMQQLSGKYPAYYVSEIMNFIRERLSRFEKGQRFRSYYIIR